MLSASLALGEDFKMIDGKEYRDATVTRVEPDGIVVKTKSGISKLYFVELPKEVQQRFNYDPQQARTYSTEQAANYAAYQKQEQEAGHQRDDAAAQNDAGFGQQQARPENNPAVPGGRPGSTPRSTPLPKTQVLHFLPQTQGSRATPPPAKPAPKPAPVHHEKAEPKKTHK
jgi:sRNA-binding protein